MKKIYFFLFILIGKLSYSQNQINRETGVPANGLNISFHPTDLLTNITISTRSSQNEKGMFFFFTGKGRIPPPSIRIDSLILKSNNNEFLTLHHPDYDSIISNGRNLSWQVMHSLSLQEAEFIKEKKIVSITLIVNRVPVQIFFSKKSQGLLNKLAISSW